MSIITVGNLNLFFTNGLFFDSTYINTIDIASNTKISITPKTFIPSGNIVVVYSRQPYLVTVSAQQNRIISEIGSIAIEAINPNKA